MIDGRARPADRQAHPLTRAFPLTMMTVAAFVVAFAILMARLHAGVDPALLSRRAGTPQPARQVLLRKVYERIVVVHLPASSPPQPASASQQIGPVSASVGAATATVTRSS